LILIEDIQLVQAILQQWQPVQLKSLSSIKGIVKRDTVMLIVYTQGLKFTQCHRHLIIFAGLSPTEYSSGSIIQGKLGIYKRVGKNLRDVLYMRSMNAIKTKITCKSLV
jgi:transposase